MPRKQLVFVCPYCRANRSAGERCECQQIDLHPERIPEADLNGLARAVLANIKKAFEDPAIEAEYQKWLIEYRKRPGVLTN